MRPPFASAILVSLLAASTLAASALAADAPESITGADPSKECAARRAALAAALPPESLAIVPAVRADPGALTAPRQNEDYTWLVGSEEPGGILLVGASPAGGKPPFELLLLPPRNAASEGWIGPRLYPGEKAQAATGIAATEDSRKAVELLGGLLKGAKTVLLPRGGEAGEHAERLFGDLLRERKVETKDLGPFTGCLRLVKSAEEIARIRRASELSAEGHRRAMRAARAGMPEYAVQAVLEEACREGGCRRQAYDSIVGSGPNACVLHYSRDRRILEEGELVLVDAAGEYLGYATDVTRTWPVGAKFTEEQARAYDAVLAAQEAGIAAAKPGVTFREISEACARVLKERGYEKAQRHGPCHWVGLNVHDPNDTREKPAALRPGVVFTIEPGAYFPEKGFGIRIEDTFAMREDGTLDCLSKDAPKERAAIEALRAAALAAPPPK